MGVNVAAVAGVVRAPVAFAGGAIDPLVGVAAVDACGEFEATVGVRVRATPTTVGVSVTTVEGAEHAARKNVITNKLALKSFGIGSTRRMSLCAEYTTRSERIKSLTCGLIQGSMQSNQ